MFKIKTIKNKLISYIQNQSFVIPSSIHQTHASFPNTFDGTTWLFRFNANSTNLLKLVSYPQRYGGTITLLHWSTLAWFRVVSLSPSNSSCSFVESLVSRLGPVAMCLPSEFVARKIMPLKVKESAVWHSFDCTALLIAPHTIQVHSLPLQNALQSS